jgi:hypothetical protein
MRQGTYGSPVPPSLPLQGYFERRFKAAFGRRGPKGPIEEPFREYIIIFFVISLNIHNITL